MGIGRARTARRGPALAGPRGPAAPAGAAMDRSRLAATLRLACKVRAERDARRTDPAPVDPEQLAVERQILSVARAAATSGNAARAAAIARLDPALVSRLRRLAVQGDSA